MNLKDTLGKWINVFDKQITSKLLHELNILYRTKQVCPSPENVFKAFQLCPYDICKVVMIGMDPYPQKDVATGILFGNKEDTLDSNLSPSLQIIKEACLNEGELLDKTLESWCNQGVLMLNSALTVEQDNIGSHTMLWRPFMTSFLRNYSNMEPGQIYVLFGEQAKSLKYHINPRLNHILEYKHPAYFARQKESMPKDIFESINNLLILKYETQIYWGKTNESKIF